MDLTEEELKKEAGCFDLECITELCLAEKEVSGIIAIRQCSALCTLDLSRNSVSSLDGLGGLKVLETLDLSHNSIRSLKGLEELPALRTLLLQGNKIDSLDELYRLGAFSALRTLSFSGEDGFNPVCEHPSYVATVVQTVPHLAMLDGENLLLKRCTSEKSAIEENLRQEEARIQSLVKEFESGVEILSADALKDEDSEMKRLQQDTVDFIGSCSRPFFGAVDEFNALLQTAERLAVMQPRVEQKVDPGKPRRPGQRKKRK